MPHQSLRRSTTAWAVASLLSAVALFGCTPPQANPAANNAGRTADPPADLSAPPATTQGPNPTVPSQPQSATNRDPLFCEPIHTGSATVNMAYGFTSDLAWEMYQETDYHIDSSIACDAVRGAFTLGYSKLLPTEGVTLIGATALGSSWHEIRVWGVANSAVERTLAEYNQRTAQLLAQEQAGPVDSRVVVADGWIFMVSQISGTICPVRLDQVSARLAPPAEYIELYGKRYYYSVTPSSCITDAFWLDGISTHLDGIIDFTAEVSAPGVLTVTARGDTRDTSYAHDFQIGES